MVIFVMKQRTSWTEWGGVGVWGVSDATLWSGRKESVEQRLKGHEGVSCVFIWGKREKPVQRPGGRSVPGVPGEGKGTGVVEQSGMGCMRPGQGGPLQAPLSLGFTQSEIGSHHPGPGKLLTWSDTAMSLCWEWMEVELR